MMLSWSTLETWKQFEWSPSSASVGYDVFAKTLFGQYDSEGCRSTLTLTEKGPRVGKD